MDMQVALQGFSALSQVYSTVVGAAAIIAGFAFAPFVRDAVLLV